MANEHLGQPKVPAGTQTLARGLEVLRAIAGGSGTLAEVCAATDLGRSTAHRLLQLLDIEGFVRSSRGRGYSLGPALIELGFQALHQSPIPDVARPALEQLSEKYLDTIHLAIEDDSQVLYIDKIPGARGAEMRSRVGYRMPLTRAGIGKALLMDQPERWSGAFGRENPDASRDAAAGFVRKMTQYSKQAAAFDWEENEPGIRCVAAPVRDGSGSTVAAISISATKPYMPTDRMRALVPVMAQAAERVSRQLGHTPRA